MTPTNDNHGVPPIDADLLRRIEAAGMQDPFDLIDEDQSPPRWLAWTVLLGLAMWIAILGVVFG